MMVSIRAHGGTLQALQHSFLLTGQQYDAKAHGPAAGLYYMRARFYDPAIGRFINADPLEGTPSAPQSLNRYAYALNNPTNRVDPTGLDSEGTAGPVFDCQTGLLFGAIVMILFGSWLMATSGVFAAGAFTLAALHGLEAMAAYGVGVTAGGLLLSFGLLSVYDACTGSDSRHSIGD